MPVTALLNSSNAPLQRLALSRLMLDSQDAICMITTEGEEILLYSLIGTVRVRDVAQDWGTIGGRRAVTESGVQALRFPGGRAHAITVQLVGTAADLLVASCVVDIGAMAAVAHREDIAIHDVGTASHRREVRVLPTPLGYQLHVGETLAPAGNWSSWPSHAAPDDLGRYEDHEEVFFLVTPGRYGLIRFDGFFCDGSVAKGVQQVRNGDALVTPLGAHEIVAAPEAWLYYAWVYRSFLRKTYNAAATDCGVYVR